MITPVYVKHADDEPLPCDRVWYLVTASGLFLNRCTPLFNTSVPCKHPVEFARHEAIIQWRLPIPQVMIEQIVGFFSFLNRQQPGTESIVLLAWAEQRGYEAIVPDQTAMIARYPFGMPAPVGVRYEVPNLPPGMVLAGDVHSHAFLGAFESETDHRDVRFRDGLHLVVGQVDLNREPPDLYATVCVDGYKCVVSNPQSLLAGYRQRSADFPKEWLSQVHICEVPAPVYPTGKRTLEFRRKEK
jgi:hypothetical protein